MTSTALHDAEVADRFNTLVGRFKRDVSLSDPRLIAILRNLPDVDCPRILDIGCGKGRFARHLEGGGAQVVGLDLSAMMLQEATGLKRVKATARSLPFANGTFDAIIAVETMEHISDLTLVIRETRRVLRSGGRLIVVDKNLWSLNAQRPWLPSAVVKWIDERRGRWMYPMDGPVRERWFSPSRLRATLKTQFDTVKVEHLLSESEQKHGVFRLIPSARLMTCWTATAPWRTTP